MQSILLLHIFHPTVFFDVICGVIQRHSSLTFSPELKGDQCLITKENMDLIIHVMHRQVVELFSSPAEKIRSDINSLAVVISI